MMLVMRFLMSLGCWWCFCNFTGKPPPHPPIFWFKSKPWVGWVRRSPWTCRARRGCHLWDPESLQSTAPWCVEKMTRGFPGGCRPGRWLRWGTKKHSENGTYISCGTQGGSVKLPVIAIPIIAVPIIAISMNKPLFGARCLLYLSPRTCLKQIHLSWNPLCAATTVAAEG